MEATIDELVDNLIKEKHLDGKEADEITETLELASKYIEPSRLSGFVRSVREKIDAPTSEIFTQNGLNLNELKNVADVVATVVIKEQVKDSEKNKNNNVSEYTQGDTKDVNQDDNKKDYKEIHFEEILAELDYVYKIGYGIEPSKVSEETKREMAQGIINGENYLNIIKELEENGVAGEDLLNEADKRAGYESASEKDQRNIDILDTVVYQATEECKRTGNPLNEVLQKKADAFPNLIQFFGADVFNAMKNGFMNSQKARETRIQLLQTKIRTIELEQNDISESIKNLKKTGFKHQGLLVKMVDYEKKEEELSKLRRQKEEIEELTPEKKVKIREKKKILDEAKSKYYTTNKTAYEIFEDLKKEGKHEDISVYDIIHVVSEEVLNVNPLDYNNILGNEIKMIRLSKEIAAMEQLKANAMKFASGDERDRLVQDYTEKIAKAREKITSKRSDTMKVKNTVVNFKGGDKSYINQLQNDDNRREEVIPNLQTTNEEYIEPPEPKKKKGFMSFIKNAVSKLGITSKDVGEEVSVLSDLQKQEVHEESIPPKTIKDNKTNSSIEVATINVGGEEPVVEQEEPNVEDDGR